MANDHYVPQFLTAPWEFSDRRLRVFDFATRRFSDPPARTLLARQDLNSRPLEDWMRDTIETPVGTWCANLRRGPELAVPRDWKTHRGLALLFFLNSQRLAEGRWGENEVITLEQLAAKGDAFATQIARFFLERFKLFCVRVPSGSELFFTEVVQFAYPMPERPVACIPLGLNHIALAYDGPLSAEQLLKNVSKGLLTKFSLGLGRDVHRVILPPVYRQASMDDEERVRDALLEIRTDLCELFDLVGRFSDRVGLTGWQVTK